MATPGLTVPFSFDEQCRQGFTASMRTYVLNDLADHMRDVYEHRTKPTFERAQGQPPSSGPEVHKAMRRETIFKFYSALRCGVQEMCWRSVIPGVRRAAGDLNAAAASMSAEAAARIWPVER